MILQIKHSYNVGTNILNLLLFKSFSIGKLTDLSHLIKIIKNFLYSRKQKYVIFFFYKIAIRELFFHSPKTKILAHIIKNIKWFLCSHKAEILSHFLKTSKMFSNPLKLKFHHIL